MDCDFKASANTIEELMAKCAEHAKADHGMAQIPSDLIAKVQAAVRDV
jgi:predicted small metal-binding protein